MDQCLVQLCTLYMVCIQHLCSQHLGQVRTQHPDQKQVFHIIHRVPDQVQGCPILWSQMWCNRVSGLALSGSVPMVLTSLFCLQQAQFLRICLQNLLLKLLKYAVKLNLIMNTMVLCFPGSHHHRATRKRMEASRSPALYQGHQTVERQSQYFSQLAS